MNLFSWLALVFNSLVLILSIYQVVKAIQLKRSVRELEKEVIKFLGRHG